METTSELICQICFEPDALQGVAVEFSHIVKTICGHYYHLECISNWVAQKQSCPMCKHELQLSDFYEGGDPPNRFIVTAERRRQELAAEFQADDAARTQTLLENIAAAAIDAPDDAVDLDPSQAFIAGMFLRRMQTQLQQRQAGQTTGTYMAFIMEKLNELTSFLGTAYISSIQFAVINNSIRNLYNLFVEHSDKVGMGILEKITFYIKFKFEDVADDFNQRMISQSYEQITGWLSENSTEDTMAAGSSQLPPAIILTERIRQFADGTTQRTYVVKSIVQN
jgi:hypothetical protein